jgi:segregation and condensation protein B
MGGITAPPRQQQGLAFKSTITTATPTSNSRGDALDIDVSASRVVEMLRAEIIPPDIGRLQPVVQENNLELKSLVESLLFVADRPVPVRDLAEAIAVDATEIESALQLLDVEYQQRGIRLQRKEDKVQLVSAPEAGSHIERFLGLEISGRLSVAALETLSIIAYRQPITRAQIEAIRGVHSDSVLRSLVRRGLVEQIGRASTVGRPNLFGTTFEFLEQFGLQRLSELPDWEKLGRTLEERIETEE